MNLGLSLTDLLSYVHFTTVMPTPISVTHSVYDIATLINNFTTQVALIDAVFLREDMRRLLPMTAMYANNAGWENVAVQLEDIETKVLENMIFDDLMWCDDLREIAADPSRNRVESQNGRLWFVSVNEDNMPCFDTIAVFGQETQRSCITTCDILARNGLVHELDKIMLFEAPETVGPQAPLPPIARNPSAPIFQYNSPTASNSGIFASPSYSGSFGAQPASAPVSSPSSAQRLPVLAALVASVALLAWGL